MLWFMVCSLSLCEQFVSAFFDKLTFVILSSFLNMYELSFFFQRYGIFWDQAYSCLTGRIFSTLPKTVRGAPTVLKGDPKGKNFLYTNGTSVIIRDIEVGLIYFCKIILARSLSFAKQGAENSNILSKFRNASFYSQLHAILFSEFSCTLDNFL